MRLPRSERPLCGYYAFHAQVRTTHQLVEIPLGAPEVECWASVVVRKGHVEAYTKDTYPQSVGRSKPMRGMSSSASGGRLPALPDMFQHVSQLLGSPLLVSPPGLKSSAAQAMGTSSSPFFTHHPRAAHTLCASYTDELREGGRSSVCASRQTHTGVFPPLKC